MALKWKTLSNEAHRCCVCTYAFVTFININRIHKIEIHISVYSLSIELSYESKLVLRIYEEMKKKNRKFGQSKTVYFRIGNCDAMYTHTQAKQKMEFDDSKQFKSNITHTEPPSDSTLCFVCVYDGRISTQNNTVQWNVCKNDVISSIWNVKIVCVFICMLKVRGSESMRANLKLIFFGREKKSVEQRKMTQYLSGHIESLHVIYKEYYHIWEFRIHLWISNRETKIN